jgi:ATP-dependent Clp protease ATP-binding subunit ClpB
LTLSQTTNKTLIEASNIAKKMKDEYVSIEHLILAIFKSKDTVSQQLKDQGVSEMHCRLPLQSFEKEKMLPLKAQKSLTIL